VSSGQKVQDATQRSSIELLAAGFIIFPQLLVFILLKLYLIMSCTSCSTASMVNRVDVRAMAGAVPADVNRMNTHDWLRTPAMSDLARFKVMEVIFSQGTRKDFFRNAAFNP